MEKKKEYVSVLVDIDESGCMMLTDVIWADGRRYEIDRIEEVLPAAASEAGGQGVRYTILISGKRRYLFFERSTCLKGTVVGRFFVEIEK